MSRSTESIARHRTAQRRTNLSSPMRHLMDLGFLDGQHTLFDYGCGRGDDLRLLGELNVTAAGWDPVFRPENARRQADIVNLGFVLNVIEDAVERQETLKSAFELATKVLAVSVMLGYAAKRSQFAAHNDGVRTQRNTFQKYFTQEEFRTYVERTLNANAIPIAAGICLVFRNPVEEQLFLLARQQVKREWRMLRREPASDAIATTIEVHRPQIDAYWGRVLELGRPSVAEECPNALPLTRLVGSWKRVHDWVGQFFDPEELEAAAIARQEDLLVYFALGHFRRRRAYAELPARLQRDVRYFFGNITKATAAGKRALFAVADGDRLAETALFCHNELGIGRLNGSHDLTFHQSVLGECLPLVRIYVGCALMLFGDAGSVDLIKVHLQSSKVTFLTYDDFERGTPANLVERIKVDLGRRRVDFFDYTGGFNPQPLSVAPSEFYQR